MNMKRNIALLVFSFCMSMMLAEGRVWTNTAGKTVEGDFVSVDQENVVVKIKGKDQKLPIKLLSEKDQLFIKQQGDAGAPAPNADAFVVANTEIIPDQNIVFQVPFNEKELQLVKKDKSDLKEMRFSIILHPDFDKTKEQKWFLVKATYSGNEGTGGDRTGIPIFREIAKEKGWNILAMDSDKGLLSGGNLNRAIILAGFRVLQEARPEIESDLVATGGVSGGAKSAQSVIALMHKMKIKPGGLFLSGCSSYSGFFFKSDYQAPQTCLSKVPVFVSNGTKDNISTIASAEDLIKYLKEMGKVKSLRFEKYEGGHAPYKPHIKEALTWFELSVKKK